MLYEQMMSQEEQQFFPILKYHYDKLLSKPLFTHWAYLLSNVYKLD